MKIRFAYKEGWGYIVEVHKNGFVVESQARGDCWDDLRKFETGDMPESALKEASMHLAEIMRNQYGIINEIVFDPSLLPAKYR